MDEYTVDSKFMNGFLIYFKNGILHREVGPVMIPVNDKEKYCYAEDEKLYKNGAPKIDPFTTMKVLAIIANFNRNDELSYYIDGKSCSQEKFYSLKLKKDLDKELTNNHTETKKAKI